MDIGELNRRMNDAVNGWISGAKAYFSHLSRNEQYGWLGVLVGVVLIVAGVFLL